MKIGIDLRCLMEGKKTGVEEYTLNILENLFELDKNNQYVLFLNSYKVPKVCLQKFLNHENVHVKYFRFPNKLLNLFLWYLDFPKIDRLIGGVDIVFFPNINFGSVSRKSKLLLTLHDLSFIQYPETFSFKRRLWHFFINPKRLSRKAAKIIAVSDSTKKDITNLYDISEGKMKVIQNAVSDDFRVIDRNDQKLVEVKNKYKLPYKFILYLGTIEPRKNIISVIRAFNKIKDSRIAELEKYKLVIAGSKGWKYEKIFQEAKNSKYNKDIIFTGYISDEDKPYFYGLSSLFIYPSFFEGFGFPVLEAMKCGIPVITSNNSSLPEVAGSAAILVDPDKPDEIFKSAKEILTNNDLHQKLSRKGLWQAKKFNWKQSAREFLKVLNTM